MPSSVTSRLTNNDNRRRRSAFPPHVMRHLDPQDTQVIFELDGQFYPDGFELISAVGLRKLLPHLDGARKKKLEALLSAASTSLTAGC